MSGDRGGLGIFRRLESALVVRKREERRENKEERREKREERREKRARAGDPLRDLMEEWQWQWIVDNEVAVAVA